MHTGVRLTPGQRRRRWPGVNPTSGTDPYESCPVQMTGPETGGPARSGRASQWRAIQAPQRSISTQYITISILSPPVSVTGSLCGDPPPLSLSFRPLPRGITPLPFGMTARECGECTLALTLPPAPERSANGATLRCDATGRGLFYAASHNLGNIATVGRTKPG